jgi:large subunit ribosomal protein L30
VISAAGSEEKDSKTIRVRWIRSAIGFPYQQKRMVRSLGLRRLQQVVELPDTASVRGLVARLAHLVQVLEEEPLPGWLSVPEYSIQARELSSEKVPSEPVMAAQQVEAAPAEASRVENTPEALPGVQESESETPPAASNNQE